MSFYFMLNMDAILVYCRQFWWCGEISYLLNALARTYKIYMIQWHSESGFNTNCRDQERLFLFNRRQRKWMVYLMVSDHRSLWTVSCSYRKQAYCMNYIYVLPDLHFGCPWHHLLFGKSFILFSPSLLDSSLSIYFNINIPSNI